MIEGKIDPIAPTLNSVDALEEDAFSAKSSKPILLRIVSSLASESGDVGKLSPGLGLEEADKEIEFSSPRSAHIRTQSSIDSVVERAPTTSKIDSLAEDVRNRGAYSIANGGIESQVQVRAGLGLKKDNHYSLENCIESRKI